MLKRLRLRKTDEGQGLIIVIAVVAVAAIVLGALEVSVIGDAKLAATSTSQEQALQAAETGLADYETNVNGSASQWQYAMAYCSSGTFECAPNGTDTAPDPQNAAYSGIPDPSCTTSAYNATQGTEGSDNYFGWETVHGSSSGGYSEQFQYIVDSSKATTLGGYVHIWITGRAGNSGRYTCSTIKALYNGPQLTTVNTVQLSPASCSGSTIPVVAPTAATTIARVLIEATGGTGQTGGSGGLGAGGGVGGLGETVEATYAATNASTLYVNLGCQGGSNTTITQGGPGFAPGGALPSNGDAGGGGGATAVCAITPCTSANITTANLANEMYMVAGGGGGGGEGILGFSGAGGKGGNGVTTTVTSGVAENGSNGSNASGWFNDGNPGLGGAGGKATSGFSPAGGAGTKSSGGFFNFNTDGGGGGAGYNGASGGGVGFGGGGGGAGASFYNTNTSPAAGGIGAYISGAAGTGFAGAGTTMSTTPSNYGSVIIQWETSTGAAVGTPVVPSSCGPYSERTTQIPALSDVSLQVSGGSGGYGDYLGDFGIFSTNGPEGVGATVVATYQNTSTLPVDVTAIQGCQGAIGGLSGDTAGGDGLRSTGSPTSGGANCSGCSQGDAGSGGGASAICVGTIAPGNDSPTNNNCTAGASSLLMAAGGGGGGGGIAGPISIACNGGAGGNGGADTASDWPASTNLTTGGVAGTNGANSPSLFFLCTGATGGAGGTGALANYAPTGGVGSNAGSCSGDGGGAGGGMDGGSGGGSGSCLFGIFAGVGAGGGGGSSYLAPSNGAMQLQACPVGSQCLYSACPTSGQSNPATNQINTSNVAVTEGEWCNGQLNTNGAVSITDTAIPNSSAVLSQSPTPVPTTAAALLASGW